MRLLSESELKTVSGGFAPAAPAISSNPNETTTPPAQPLPQPQLVGPGLIFGYQGAHSHPIILL